MGKSLGRTTELPAKVAPAFGVIATYPIKLTANLDTIDISLTGGMDVTGAGGALLGDGIAELISSVDLVGDDSVTLCSVPFSQLVNGNIWRRTSGNAPIVSQPALGIAVNAFSAIATLDVKAFLALRPKDTALVEQQFSILELRCNIGADFSKVVSGGTISVAGSNVALNVVAHETVELPDANNVVSKPVKRILMSSRDNNIAGATKKEYMRLTPGQLLRGLTIRTRTASGANSDVPLDAFRVYVGNSLRYNVSGAGIIAENQAGMKAARTTGYYFINFTKQTGSVERLNDALDLLKTTLNGADAYVEYDVNEACIVNIMQSGHEPV